MAGASLVVVDDDPKITSLLRIALTRNGYEIHASHCGSEALELVRERRPDAVVLDLHMPGMSGQDVLDQMKADRSLARVPVIVATGETDSPELKGAFATVTKPFSLKLLYSTLRDALECS